MLEFPLSAEQAALCRQMARLAGLGGFIIDLTSGQCVWCADEVARIHGLPVAEGAVLLGTETAWLERIDPADRARYREARAGAAEPGGGRADPPERHRGEQTRTLRRGRRSGCGDRDGRRGRGERCRLRDDLLARPQATAQDMVAIQLDDRALFLARWRDLLLELLKGPALDGHAQRATARKLIEGWSGRAAADDAGYRLVRASRLQIRKDVFESLTASVRAAHPERKFAPSSQFEGPLWQLVTARPLHLLDPKFQSWEQALLASVDTALESLSKECAPLDSCTWGRANTLAMRHPLSSAVPLIGRWLDMPAQPLSGDSSMPRVQGATFGASERLVVSPGRVCPVS